MAASQSANFNLQEFTDAGLLLVGGQLYTYFYGTTTFKPAYTDAAATVPHTYTSDGLGGQYIALNARGELPAPLYLATGAYDLTLKRADGSMVWTRKADGVDGVPNALRAELATQSGAALVGTTQVGVGAVATTVESVLRNLFSTSYTNFATAAQQVSILAGADATLFIQAAIDALPVGGRLHGTGSVLNVTSLLMKSDTTLSNFALKTKAGALDFAAPITIDGRTTKKVNIHLIDITVDGNRINQTSIVSGSEDGGRHCFRLVGAMENITIERCTGNYGAGDGIELFSSTSATADDSNYVFQKITIRDCTFNYNRRHGMSGDSIKRLLMENVELTYNGLDLNGTDPLTSGGRGARVGGSLYGNGIDFEGYGLGSGMREIRLSTVTALYNARTGVAFYDASAARGAGFVARSKIWIADCYFDEGSDSSRSGEALSFTSTIGSKALAPLYDSVYINNIRLEGRITARNISNFQIDGDITAPGVGGSYAILDYAEGAVLAVVPRGPATIIESYNTTFSLGKEPIPTPTAPTLARTGGVTGTLTSIVTTVLENVRDRTARYLITADWTASGAGVPVFSLTPASGSAIVAPPRIDIGSSATGLPIACNYLLSLASFRFSDPGTALLKFQIVVDVRV